MRNTAFISYSHAADGKLAPALQRALHNFAKPWYQLRALRVFRDKTSLAANPALWPAIELALGDSLWFLYLASPLAAQSYWVQREIRWWLEHRTSANMLILLTDGELNWNQETRDFDWSRTTSVPESLRGEFKDEPLYVDLRWARTAENLSLRHSQFRGVILDIAAPLHGRPKEDLDGDDVRQHRKNRAWAWSAGVSLAILFVMATGFAIYAIQQGNEALRQRDEAVGRLYAQQLARAGDLVSRDPGVALDVLDETLRSAGELREFTWDLHARLASRTVFATGGVWNHQSPTDKDAWPVLALSHDGTRLATALERPTNVDQMTASDILLWDTGTGALLATLPLATGSSVGDKRIGAIAFSPNDRELAASAGTSVKVWESSTGRELMAVDGDRDVRFLLLAGVTGPRGTDGGESRQLIAFGGEGGGTVWNSIGPHAAKRRLESTYPGAVTLGRDGRSVFIAGPAEIERWDLATGARSSVRNPAGAVSLLALSPDGERLAQASGSDILVWRRGRDAVEWSLERGHREWVRALAFRPDGRMLASGGSDGTVRLWDLDRGVATLTMRGPKAAVTVLEFSGDGTRLAAGGADASAFVWDVAGPPVRPVERIETNLSPTCVGFSPEGGSLALATGSTMTVRHPLDDPQARTLAVGTEIRSCGISLDGKVAFAVDAGLHVVVADARTGDISTRTSRVADAASVRLSADGKAVAAYVGPGTFGVWDAVTGQRGATIDVDGTLEGPFELLDGGVVVAQFGNPRGSWVGAWDTRARRQVSVAATPKWGQYRQQFGVCLARLLFASTDGEDLEIVDLGRGRLKRRLRWNVSRTVSNLNIPTRIVFSPDCSAVAVGDGVGQISSWEIASGARRYSVAAHSGMQMLGTSTSFNADGVNALEFSPDGRTLASGGGTASGHGELKLWDAARGSLLATLPAESGSVKRVIFSASGSELGVLLQRERQDVRHEATILEVWRAHGPERALLAADVAPIARVAFSPDGTRLISEGPTTTKYWHLARNQLERVRNRPKPAPSKAAPGSPNIRSLRGDSEVFVGQEVFLFVTQGAGVPPRRLVYDGAERYFPSEPIRALQIMADGTLMSLAGSGAVRPAEITRWNLTSGRPIGKAFEGSSVVASLVFSADQRTFVTIGSIGDRPGLPGFVHVWDAQLLTLIATFPSHRARVTAAAFSPDGKRLATGDANGFVRVWDLPPDRAPR